MAKKKIDKPKRELTSRQVSRWQQETKKNRIILAIGTFIIVGVLILVGVAWFINEYRPLHETVITVNDTRFDMGYFISQLKAYGKGQPTSSLYSLVGQLPGIIERNELIKEGAAKLGFTVSDDEVNKELKKANLTADFRDIVRTELLVKKLMDENFGPKIAPTAEQRQIMVMLLESKSQADEIAARLDKGEDFATLAKEFSLESLSKEKGGDLGWHPKGILTDSLGTNIVDEYAFGSQAGVLSPPMRDDEIYKIQGYWLIKVTERKEDNKQAHVYALLLSSAEQAQAVKARLENGEDVAALAKELSQYTPSQDSGGDLGWVDSGTMNKAFDDFAFNTGIGLNKWSEPIRDTSISTKGGYWLIKVSNIEADRKISDDDMNQLKGKAVNEWVASLFTDPATKIDHSPLTSDKLMFAITKASET